MHLTHAISHEVYMAKLSFFYSAMNAGKTANLLQSAYNYRERGLTPLIFAPSSNTRDGVGVVQSRIGIQADAHVFSAQCDLLERIKKHAQVDCVFVDEAQFLTPAQVLQLTQVCDELGVPVMAYGLRTDFRGEPFAGSAYLLAWADELIEVVTVCRTGKNATMSARLNSEGERVASGEQVDVGFHYTPMSRGLFNLPSVSPVAKS